MLDRKDFSRDSCCELLKSIAFAANRNNQSGLSAEVDHPTHLRNITLGAFVHGGMKGVTTRTLQHHDLTKYLITFLKHHRSQDELTLISIVQGGDLRVKSDPHNHRTGSCSLVTLGNFEGGELWIEDSDPKAIHEVVCHEKTTLTGRLGPMTDRAVLFDHNSRHRTMPWKGER